MDINNLQTLKETIPLEYRAKPFTLKITLACATGTCGAELTGRRVGSVLTFVATGNGAPGNRPGPATRVGGRQ
jgi:hypothetical protein